MSTFGRTDVAGCTGGDSGDQNYTVVSKYVLSEAGSVSKLSVYITNLAGGHAACYMKGVIYSDSGGNPLTLKGTTDALAVADSKALGWVDLTFASPVALNAGTYWIGGFGDANSSGIDYYADYAAGDSCRFGIDLYTTGPVATFNQYNVNYEHDLAVYATYTAAVFTGLTVTKLLQG